MKFVPLKRPDDATILADIAAVEKTLETELPQEIKAFLFEAAGAYPEPSGFSIPPTPWQEDGDADELEWFFGRSDGPYVRDVEAYLGRVPNNFLPFGTDGFGNPICVAFASDDFGSQVGSVWFWDHERESPDGGDDRTNCYKLADSIQEFLDGLYELEEDEDDEDYDDEDEYDE
ncbi:MAG: SMI1/KNR4 family protein [Thermoguttaceae bacterium]|nr:SMI1/KNR4 family protein [Thermoguttaceae bacterium]